MVSLCISSLLEATDYVYKIWLSLVEGARIFIFDPPSPQFWVVIFKFFLNKNVKNYLLYIFALNGIYPRVNSLGVIYVINWVILRYFLTSSEVDYPKKRLDLARKNLTFGGCADQTTVWGYIFWVLKPASKMISSS